MPMKHRNTFNICLTALALGALGTAMAQDPNRSLTPEPLRSQAQWQERERIYGEELMSEEERNVYRERLRLAHTEEERERIRHAHREHMDLRWRALNQVRQHNGKARGAGDLLPMVIPGPRGGARH